MIMLAEIFEFFEFVFRLIESIFGLVSNIMEFAFSLSPWFILTSNAILVIGIVAVVYLIVQKRNNHKAQPQEISNIPTGEKTT
jgi:F0F1-type ATP synthase assembly protein I